jgi:hypothetical protein
MLRAKQCLFRFQNTRLNDLFAMIDEHSYGLQYWGLAFI